VRIGLLGCLIVAAVGTGIVVWLAEMTQPRHGHGAAVVGSTAYALLGGERPGLHASRSVESLPLGD